MTITLSGHFVGKIWMPEVEASLPITANIERERARFSERPTYREVLEHIIREQGGDFQHAAYGFDTQLTFTYSRKKGSRTVKISKAFFLADCPSVKDLVDLDATIYGGD